MKLTTSASVALVMLGAMLTFATTASARPPRVDQIPNGNRKDCQTCHMEASGRGYNPFGSAVTNALVGNGATSDKSVDWGLLYDIDSDGDGYTNGEELGDPNGEWRTGDASPTGAITHPGDPLDSGPQVCGDGRVTPPEECEGENLRSRTCSVLGLGSGELTCTEDCLYDRSGCEDFVDDSGDAGTTADAGTDAGFTGDAGDTTSDDDTGGGCAVTLGPQHAPPITLFALLLLLGVAAARRPE